MSVLNQVKGSQFSKKGRTSTTGIFEGTPQNAALVERGVRAPRVSPSIPSIQNPTDITSNSLIQPTYLDFLKSSPIK